MSYQGGPPPGNGYWAGHSPPNPYGTQDLRAQQHAPNGAQSHYQIPSSNGQYWNQSEQAQYINPNYTHNGYYHPAPAPQQMQQVHQAQQPQFISPAQLFQQPPPPQARPSPQYLSTPEVLNLQNILNPVYENSPRMTSSSNPEHDKTMLLVSLAEEYFEAAHELAPAATLTMTESHVYAYEKLIATGLNCLEAALKQGRLSPRTEASIRLRYAGVLYEETENFMEAEMALTKGISLCDRNHFFDVKYAMQFLLVQFMAKKSPKASMKALDGHISEAQTYQHHSWVYAFRFLRASHALSSGNITDNNAAVHNLRAVTSLAEQNNDHAIYLTASLMEAMAHMSTTSAESTQHVQTAIAAAWRYQTQESCNIPQLIGLTHILAVACSIRQGISKDMQEKLKDMQTMMDNTLKDPTWSSSNDVIAVPIMRTAKSSAIVSRDTRVVLDIGDDGGDTLMMCFLSKKDAYAITYLLSGMVLLHKSSGDQKGFKYLQEGLKMLQADTRSIKKEPGTLPDLTSKRQWRGQVLCYFCIYLAFCSANIGDWAASKQHIDDLMANVRSFGIPLTGPLEDFSLYLTGVYHQGMGQLDHALHIFGDDKFSLLASKSLNTTSADQLHMDISLLAALNKLWILQDSARQDTYANNSLIDELRPFCENHASKDIQTAFNLVLATVATNPPAQLFQVKNYLRSALQGATVTANTQFLCITLNVMCSRFFSNVIGDQAEKSAMAASTQASNSGNVLWKSVADGMLANCYEVQGKSEKAQATLAQAQHYAERAVQSASAYKPRNGAAGGA